MPVENLVKFKNDLSLNQKDLSLTTAIKDKITLLEHIYNRYQLDDYRSHIDSYIGLLDDLVARSATIDSYLQDLLATIEHDIDSIAQRNVVNTDNEESRIHNHLTTTSTIEHIICSRISSYSDWRFPGLQLHCRYYRPENQNYPVPDSFASPAIRINHMVANDPLYLVGSDLEHLKEIISSYSPIYQNRLRLYEITERNLSMLPYSQFGFILCWDFLNYLSIQTVTWYLTECMKLLRPGGVLMFSYTNGELESSAKMYDAGRSAWATSKIIQKVISDIGFNVLRSENLSTDDNENTFVSWFEVQKPGELKTVRLNQATGKVLVK